jgi:hypothetical protein
MPFDRRAHRVHFGECPARLELRGRQRLFGRGFEGHEQCHMILRRARRMLIGVHDRLQSPAEAVGSQVSAPHHLRAEEDELQRNGIREIDLMLLDQPQVGPGVR